MTSAAALSAAGSVNGGKSEMEFSTSVISPGSGSRKPRAGSFAW